jgi:hypothetical protein
MTRRVTLELDSGSETINGQMHSEDGSTRPFAGWLGLAAALGDVLKPRADEPSAAPAFARGTNRGTNLSEAEPTSDDLKRLQQAESDLS